MARPRLCLLQALRHVGDDLPALARRQLRGVRRHLPRAQGEDVEDPAGRERGTRSDVYAGGVGILPLAASGPSPLPAAPWQTRQYVW